MTKARTALLALLAGIAFAAIIGVVNYFSSGLHLGRVLLAGVLFAVGMYFFARRLQRKRS